MPEIDLVYVDMIRYVHLLCVAIGFGASFLADIHVLGRLGSKITDGTLETLHHYHKIVWTALILMWITGLLLIYVRTGFVLSNFSPKLFVKIGTVSLLTINAILIGRLAMPMVEGHVGRSLINLPFSLKVRAAMIGGVSTTSWLLALALGVSKFLAASDWPVLLVIVPACYLTSLLVVTGGLTALQFRLSVQPSIFSTRHQDEPSGRVDARNKQHGSFDDRDVERKLYNAFAS